METSQPKPLFVKPAIRAMLSGSLAGLVFFAISFIAGLALAADPGNIDTGLLVIFFLPVYGLAAILFGTMIAIAVFRRQIALPPGSAGSFRATGLAVATGLVALVGLVVVASVFGRNVPGAYVPAVLCSPAYSLAGVLAGAAVYRFLRKSGTLKP